MKNINTLWSATLIASLILASSDADGKRHKQNLARTELPHTNNPLPSSPSLPSSSSLPSLANEGKSFTTIYLGIYAEQDPPKKVGKLDPKVLEPIITPLLLSVPERSRWSTIFPILNPYRTLRNKDELLVTVTSDGAIKNLQPQLTDLARQKTNPQANEQHLIISMLIPSKSSGKGFEVFYLPQIFDAKEWDTIPMQKQLRTDGGCGLVRSSFDDPSSMFPSHVCARSSFDAQCLGDILKKAAKEAEEYLRSRNAREKKAAELEQAPAAGKAKADVTNPPVATPLPESTGPHGDAQPMASSSHKRSPFFWISAGTLGLGSLASIVATVLLNQHNNSDIIQLNPVCGPLQNMSCGSVGNTMGAAVLTAAISIPIFTVGLGSVLAAEFSPRKSASTSQSAAQTQPKTKEAPPPTAAAPPSPASPPPPAPAPAAASDGSIKL